MIAHGLTPFEITIVESLESQCFNVQLYIGCLMELVNIFGS